MNQKYTKSQAIDLLKRGEAQIDITGESLFKFVKDLHDRNVEFDFYTKDKNKFAVYGEKVLFRENPVSDLPIIKLSDIVEDEIKPEFENGELVEVSSSGSIWQNGHYVGLSKTKAFVVENENGVVLKYGFCRKPIETITKEESFKEDINPYMLISDAIDVLKKAKESMRNEAGKKMVDDLSISLFPEVQEIHRSFKMFVQSLEFSGSNPHVAEVICLEFKKIIELKCADLVSRLKS